MKTVLLIEDDAGVREAVQDILKTEFNVVACDNAADGRERVQEGDVDVVLLDVLLGADDGFDLCSRLKASPATAAVPVVFLSGLAEESKRLRGFDVGGDDYILKPFSPPELLARVRARARAPRVPLRSERFGPIRLSWEMQKAFVLEREAERDALLTPLEFRILACLCRSAGHVVSRARLIEDAWGKGVNVGSRSVDKHVCTTRRKLGPRAGTIGTKAGTGYFFSPAGA